MKIKFITLITVFLLLSVVFCTFPNVKSSNYDTRPSVILVCFGDSATKGAVEEHYPGYIEEWIQPDSDDVANEGKSGETSSEGLNRLQDIIDSDEFPNAQVYAIWEGGNDLIDWLSEIDRFMFFDPSKPWYPYTTELSEKLAEIKENLKDMITLVKDSGAVPVLGTYYYLMSFKKCKYSPFNFLLPFMTRKLNHYVDKLNNMVNELSVEEDVILSNINGDLGTMPYWCYYDFNHANALGNKLIAEVWFETVNPYLDY